MADTKTKHLKEVLKPIDIEDKYNLTQMLENIVTHSSSKEYCDGLIDGIMACIKQIDVYGSDISMALYKDTFTMFVCELERVIQRKRPS